MAPQADATVRCSTVGCGGTTLPIEVGVVGCDRCGRREKLVSRATLAHAPRRGGSQAFRAGPHRLFSIGMVLLVGLSYYSGYESIPEGKRDEPYSRGENGSKHELVDWIRTGRAPARMDLPEHYTWTDFEDALRLEGRVALATASNDPFLAIWIQLDAQSKREILLLLNDFGDWTLGYPFVGSILVSGLEPNEWVLGKLVESFYWFDPGLREITRFVGQQVLASGVSPGLHDKVVDLLISP